MQMPFERLMEAVAALGPDEQHASFGQLAKRWDEPVERIMDAATALRVLAGERTHVSAAEVRAQTDPGVRQALEKDRGGIASGFSG